MGPGLALDRGFGGMISKTGSSGSVSGGDSEAEVGW